MARGMLRAAARKRRDARGAPGPRGQLLFGNTFEIRRDVLSFFLRSTQQYGDIIPYRFMIWPGHFINHPDYLKHVLVDNNRNYNKSVFDFELLRWVVGNGLVTSDGEHWLRQRRLVQPAFHRQRLAGFGQVMAGVADEWAQRWEAYAETGRSINIAEEMMRLTLKVAGLTLFRMDLSTEASAIGRAFSDASKFITEYFYFPIPRRLPLPRNRKFEAAMRALDQIVGTIIDERRRSGEDSGDLLSMLLAARDEETGEGMDKRQLRDEVMTLLLAGHETTANALTWAWYLLSKHPHVLRTLQAELDRVLGGRLPQVDDLPQLCYTHMVIAETLRLYPPAWGISRNAIAADEIGGRRIAANSNIFFSPYVMHRHPTFWKNPEGFEPERFAPQLVAQRPRFAYIPFGGGPRQCIGNNFALIEAQLVLATLAQRYELHLQPGYGAAPEPLITLRPREGMPMFVNQRRQQPAAAPAQASGAGSVAAQHAL